jgi:small multidrug resistance family-3 protein
VLVTRSIALFVLAGLAEIGGCWLVWQAVREHRPWWFAIGGALSLAAYGFVATAQPNANFGRVLAAYAGVFVAGSLLWAVAFDHLHPSRYDLIGAGICLAGTAVIIFGPGQG